MHHPKKTPRRRALIGLLACLAGAGCAGPPTREEAPLISISAVHYAGLSGSDVYRTVNAPAVRTGRPPPVTPPPAPLFYAFVRGETFPCDTPMEAVFRALAVPLAHRGYFNVVAEMQAGLKPKRIDYFLRVNSGVRRWAAPTVRTDPVTWSDYGLVSERHNPSSAYLLGDEANVDSREGPDLNSLTGLASLQQSHGTFGNEAAYQDALSRLTDEGARDRALIVVEAFRFSDVERLKNEAPCEWAVFISVPLRAGQGFSSVVREMANAATPYFGATTLGPQLLDPPEGRVSLGEPREVAPAAAPYPSSPPGDGRPAAPATPSGRGP